MKKHVICSLIIFCSMFLISSCATLFGPKHHYISTNSSPTGADVFVNGVRMGVTPIRLELKPDRSYYIKFSKEGYKPITRVVNSRVGVKWIILDVLALGLPIIIDAVTGNWNEFDQEYIDAYLGE